MTNEELKALRKAIDEFDSIIYNFYSKDKTIVSWEPSYEIKEILNWLKSQYRLLSKQ